MRSTLSSQGGERRRINKETSCGVICRLQTVTRQNDALMADTNPTVGAQSKHGCCHLSELMCRSHSSGLNCQPHSCSFTWLVVREPLITNLSTVLLVIAVQPFSLCRLSPGSVLREHLVSNLTSACQRGKTCTPPDSGTSQ